MNFRFQIFIFKLEQWINFRWENWRRIRAVTLLSSGWANPQVPILGGTQKWVNNRFFIIILCFSCHLMTNVACIIINVQCAFQLGINTCNTKHISYQVSFFFFLDGASKMYAHWSYGHNVDRSHGHSPSGSNTYDIIAFIAFSMYTSYSRLIYCCQLLQSPTHQVTRNIQKYNLNWCIDATAITCCKWSPTIN